jgi:hypothetical protein
MSLITRKPARLDTLEARIQRAKREGFACGSREAKLFRLAIGKVGFVRERALEWLNTVVDEGRAELGPSARWSAKSRRGTCRVGSRFWSRV